MNVDENFIAELISKCIEGEALAKGEYEQLVAWWAQADKSLLSPIFLKNRDRLEEQLREMAGVPSERMWEKIEQKTKIDRLEERMPAYRRLKLSAVAAAAVVTALAGIGGIYLFEKMYRPEQHLPVIASIDIPGHYHYPNKDGKDQVEDSCNSAIPFDVSLPDGSTVWLAAGSSLHYSVRSGDDPRQVWLSGQALFEVKGSKDKPFVVHAGKADVMVLGTRFNVMAYPDDVDEITLLNGKVAVRYRQKTLLLGPSEQAVITPAGVHSRRLEHPAGAIGWTEQDPYFEVDDEDLNTVVKRLGQRYKVKVVNPESVSGVNITGIFRLTDSLDVNLGHLGDAERWKARVERRNDTIFLAPFVPSASIK